MKDKQLVDRSFADFLPDLQCVTLNELNISYAHAVTYAADDSVAIPSLEFDNTAMEFSVIR